MTFLRHSSRHVLASVREAVEASLDALGWTDSLALPFGSKHAAVVRFSDAPAIAEDGIVDGVSPGLISVTLGPEFNPEEEELGGPLVRQDYPIFFDIFQPTYATTTALANDVRDTLLGRFPDTKRYITVVNQGTDEPVPGWTCELTEVEIVRPEIRLPLHWQVVKVTAECYFHEVVA